MVGLTEVCAISSGNAGGHLQKFSISDAELVKSPGQDADIYVGNLVDERNGGPVSIGYGRYAPGQSLTETIAVHDTMIVLEGRFVRINQRWHGHRRTRRHRLHAEGSVRDHHDRGRGCDDGFRAYPHWGEARER